MIFVSITFVIVGGLTYYCYFDLTNSELLDCIDTIGIQLNKHICGNITNNQKGIDEKIFLLENKLQVIENYIKITIERFNKK